MGGGSWSSNLYRSATSARIASNTPDFAHDHDVRTGRVARKVHADLDPARVAGPSSPVAGKPIRESRDSEEHPNSIPIVMFFDVTGSMQRIPKMLQMKLAELMDVVIAKAGLKDPQVLIGAIGDSTCDEFPLQVGQFESDNRFDEQLRNVILEGRGGGQDMESYALAYRFLADHTVTDAFEKRGKKGYFFMIGDEKPWPTVTAADVSKVFGVPAQEDETVESLIARASERWEIFHLFAMDGTHRDSLSVHNRWKELLPERVSFVEDSSLVCEIVASLVHMRETSSSIDRVLADVGVSGADSDVVRRALVPIGSVAVAGGTAIGGLPAGHDDGPTV